MSWHEETHCLLCCVGWSFILPFKNAIYAFHCLICHCLVLRPVGTEESQPIFLLGGKRSGFWVRFWCLHSISLGKLTQVLMQHTLIHLRESNLKYKRMNREIYGERKSCERRRIMSQSLIHQDYTSKWSFALQRRREEAQGGQGPEGAHGGDRKPVS